MKDLKKIVRSHYTVKGEKYTVKWKKDIITEDGRHAWGLCDNHLKEIYLSEDAHFNWDCPKDKKVQRILKTLLHELGHALHEEIGLHVTHVSPDLFEILVESHADLVLQSFLVPGQKFH